MALNFDGKALDIACPHCSNNIQEKLGRLKTDPELTCPACSKTFTVDASKFRDSIAEAEKTLDSFMADIGRMFK